MKRKTKKAAPRKKQTRTIDKRKAFLAAFAICADLTAAARAVGIDRSEHYRWLKVHPRYVAQFAAAKEHAAQSLEDEATTRAMVGVFEPNVYQGRFCYPQEQYEIEPGTPAVLDTEGKVATPAVPPRLGWRDVPNSTPLGTWKKSDFLLATRLRAALPAYRANAVEVTGAGGGPIEVGIVERLNAARARVAKAKEREKL